MTEGKESLFQFLRRHIQARRTEAAIYSWQQTADAAETENAAWRGFARSVEILCDAIDGGYSITNDGKVYSQERWARRLKLRIEEIKGLRPAIREVPNGLVDDRLFCGNIDCRRYGT